MKRHLIGVGGVGMSALATTLLRLGDEVTGADRTLGTRNIRFLESIGIRCFPDDGSGIDASTDEVIISTAIEETNPGLLKAQSLGIPVTHRAKALARTLAPYKLVAVVGTCGKSTVTAMLGHVLTECGLDPMCVNGANVPGWEGAMRFGRGEYAVAEVDESDKSLVAFSPYAAIVTNASADHYSKEEMDEVFDAFIKDCPGPVVDGRERNNRIGECSNDRMAAVDCPSSIPDEVEVSMPGRHNRQNAALALRMAVALGCDEARARAALKTFGGVERRLQRVFMDSTQKIVHAACLSDAAASGEQASAPAVYDDYAHNPEKVRAMWTTLAEVYPKGICVVWRPHGYAPIRKMLKAFAEMFTELIRPQDMLLLMPIFDAGGTANRTISARALYDEIRSNRVMLVDDYDSAFGWILVHCAEFGAFVTAGARDPGLPLFAERIARAVC